MLAYHQRFILSIPSVHYQHGDYSSSIKNTIEDTRPSGKNNRNPLNCTASTNAIHHTNGSSPYFCDVFKCRLKLELYLKTTGCCYCSQKFRQRVPIWWRVLRCRSPFADAITMLSQSTLYREPMNCKPIHDHYKRLQDQNNSKDKRKQLLSCVS